jgi:hypothetical protein
MMNFGHWSSTEKCYLLSNYYKLKIVKTQALKVWVFFFSIFWGKYRKDF